MSPHALGRRVWEPIFGVADNPRAASALARFSPRKIAPEVLSERDFAKFFHDLPLAALGLEAETVIDMAKAGLRRIGDVALRPRAPIAARFGRMPIARLDELKGLQRASIAPRFPPPDFCVERRFASPVQTVEAIETALKRLAGELVRLLERQARGARRIELALFHVDGRMRRIRVGASRPVNEARVFLRLFAEKLANPDEDALDAGFGIDCLRLACLETEPLAPEQAAIARAEEAEQARALADLVDRLSARLGRAGRDAARALRCASARAGGGGVSGDQDGRAGAGDIGSGRVAVTAFAAFRAARADRNADGGSPGWAASALPLAALAARPRRLRRPGAHRPALVAKTRRPDPRLFPRRRFRRPPFLALPRRLMGRGDSAAEMVRARSVRVKSFSRFAGEGGAKRRMREVRMRDDISVAAKSRARAMRVLPTDAERRLWYALRDRRLQMLKFRRQAPIGPYIVDFLCIAHRLIVEADGSQHAESRRDSVRDAWLRQQGYSVLRFSNRDILTTPESVLATIAATCGLPW